MENKIKISFKNEFQMEVKSLKIDGDWAYVNVNENSNVYYCRLNSKGVKKNSWRIDILM